MEGKRIGMLGAGNMAAALIRGMLASGSVSPDQIRASDVRKERLAELHEEYAIGTTSDNRELTSWANLIVLAVKPQVIDRVLDQISDVVEPGKLVVSIAAGDPLHRSALAGRRERDARDAEHGIDCTGGSDRHRTGRTRQPGGYCGDPSALRRHRTQRGAR